MEYTFSGTLASVRSRKIELLVLVNVPFPQPGQKMRLSDNAEKAFACCWFFNAQVEALRSESVRLSLRERGLCNLEDGSQAHRQGKRRHDFMTADSPLSSRHETPCFP